MKEINVPICEKANLTLREAAAYSNIGMDRLRKLTDDNKCDFVIFVGNKRLIKRKQFDAFLSSTYYIP